jgi:L-aspartate oxidase
MTPPVELESLDLLVLGSGVAGLSAAVRAAEVHGMRVGVLTKGELHQATTRWAQGGVAAVLHDDPDSTDLHLADTLAAGAGLCDPDAVRVLVDEGPGRVNELIALGARFDRDEQGQLDLAREGGHSLPRIVHAGGAATGVEIERALVEAVHRTAAVVLEDTFALDLVVRSGACAGVVAQWPDGSRDEVSAANVLIATGGAGQLFSVTTNPLETTGDGIAMAMRAGAAVADIEFVQFHPTALHHPSMPRPLLSEALRGHGALLRDADGKRFVDELLPRDQVSRAETSRMIEQGVDHLWLDATALEDFEQRFPTIAGELRSVGLDPTKDWLPIAPAAHYLCGGVLADLDGAATLEGLWAAGEAACSGVHGANRLASNSLLEGMVFAFRVVEAIERGKRAADPTGAMRAFLETDEPSAIRGRPVPVRSGEPGRSPSTAELPATVAPEAAACQQLRQRLQRTMTTDAGVLRSADSTERAMTTLAELAATVGAMPSDGRDLAELRNLLDLGAGLLRAASARQESRGAHIRSDHPSRDDARFRTRLVLAGEHRQAGG